MKQSQIATLGFVHQPAGPGLLRICPKCTRWWALEFIRGETDEQHGTLHHYRCKKCENEVAFSPASDPRNLHSRSNGSKSCDTR